MTPISTLKSLKWLDKITGEKGRIHLYSAQQLRNMARAIEEYEVAYKVVNGNRCRVQLSSYGQFYIDKTPMPIFASFSRRKMREMTQALLAKASREL